jgi:hypothetical protein
MIRRNLKFVAIVVVVNYMSEFHPISGNKVWNVIIYSLAISVVWIISELLIDIFKSRERFK